MTFVMSLISLSLIAIKVIVTMPSLEWLLVHVPAGFDKINSAQLSYAVIAAMITIALFIARDTVRRVACLTRIILQYFSQRDYGKYLVTSGQVVLIALHCLFLLVHKPHNLLLFSFFSVIARFSIDVLSSQGKNSFKIL